MNLRSQILGSGTGIHSGEVVSAEEDMHLMQVATESLHEMELEHDKIERLQGVAVGFEGLIDVCNHINEASATDVCLVEAATELGMAGTGVKAEEVLPGLESNVGEVVGVEGIKEVVKNIWETIVKMLKNIWKKVQDFFASIFKAVPRLRKAAEKLRARAEEKSGKTTEESKVEVGRLASVFCKGDNYAPVSSREVLTELRWYNEVSGDVFEDYTSELELQGKDLIKAIGDYAPEAESTHVHAVARAMSPTKSVLVEKVFKSDKAIPTTDPRFTEYGNRGLNSRHMLAGRAFICLKSTAAQREDAGGNGLDKDVAKLRNVASIRTNIVMSSHDSDKELPSEGEMDVLSPGACVDIAEEVLSICDAITNYYAGKSFKKVKDTADKLKKVTDKKADAVAKAADKISGDQQAAWRAVASCNTAWTGWATRTQVQFEGHLMSVARASLELANKSLSLYK